MGSEQELISISLDSDDLKWLRRRAREESEPLSAVVTEAIRLLRQREEQEQQLKKLGREITDAEADEIRAESRR